MDLLEELDDLDLQHQLQPERQPQMHRIRIDLFNSISNPNLFKRRYHFSKENAREITEMVRPIFDINSNRRSSDPFHIVVSVIKKNSLA